MARRSNVSTRINTLLANLSPAALSATADFLEQVAVNNANEELGEAEVSTRAARRKARAAAKAEAEKPARGGRTSRRASAKDEDAKPTRSTRRAAKAEADDEKPARRPRAAKVEAFEDDVTVDDLFAVLEDFEGEPVAGGIRELKPLVEAYGLDVATIYEIAEEEAGDKLTTAEKANELGVALASCKYLEAKIVATLKEDEGAMDEIIEELDLEISERASNAKIAKLIVTAINEDLGADEDAEEEADDEEDEEEVKPARRGRRAAKAEADDEEDEKPARGRRGRKAKDEDDDLADLDDLD